MMLKHLVSCFLNYTLIFILLFSNPYDILYTLRLSHWSDS